MRTKLCLLAVLACASLPAANITWNFTGNGGTLGQSQTFNSGGVTATVSAWGLTSNSNTRFAAATLGQYATGLGVCNADEGSNCNDPAHQVDNAGENDFILVLFSSLIDPLSIVIDPYNSWDRDVSYYTGNVASNVNLTGLRVSDLAGLGFGSQQNNNGTVSSSARTVALTSGYVNALLIAPSIPNSDGNTDRFKLTSLTGDYRTPSNDVPEPSTFALMGVALAAVGLWRRKQ